ncbi:hypothetical protein PB01_10470 [Psychrobacillus glaciei]|uniref:Uncharacterized protein n=1 Tax=Psychrobacillus glaciei TaxID=2283160 RepID=A0A5J6SNM3_9BACI|nr:GNAT family N-acetyltransferase [Psychrobacillus glaciei]QFF99222.1 hypothetical protein PB01_10470 [Psychrobacillus glaciei]
MSKLVSIETPVVESESIILRPLQQEIARYLFSISSPKVWAYMFGKIKSEIEMEKHVSKNIQLRNQIKALPFVVFKDTYEITGTISIYEINQSISCVK